MPLYGPTASAFNGGAVTTVLSPNAGTNSSGSAPVITPAFSSGVAARLSDITRDYMLYLVVGLAGTATVAIGPTSSPANTVVSAAAVSAGEVLTVRIPAGWYTDLTLVTATIATQLAIGC